jgi:hypothetical protein
MVKSEQVLRSTSTMTDPQLSNEISLIESLSKLFAVTLGLLYLLGFLVVASNLSQYGVSSFSVLQLQYLIAGIWVLGPPVLHASIMEVKDRFEKRAVPETPGKFNWRRFAFSSLFSGIPLALFIGLLTAIPGVLVNMTWGVGIRFLLFYAAMMNFAGLFWMSRHAENNKETWWMNRSHAAPFYFASLVMTVMSYAVWFSVRIYPLIPFSLGGGRPITIVFIEGEKKMPDAIERSAPSTKRSIPYKLLLSTDKSYVVVSPSPKERSIEISRDSVAGIVVLQ